MPAAAALPMTTPRPGPPPPKDDREPLRRDPLGLLARRVAEAGRALPRLRLAATTVVLLARPEHVREVLVERLDCIGKPQFLRASNRGAWGDGLTTLEGEAWRARRACLRGVFGRERVRAHRAVARGHARRMVEGWRAGEVIDLRRALRALTAASAVRFVLGAELQGWERAGDPAPRATRVPLAEAYGEDFTAVATGDVPLALTRPRAPAAMPVTVGIIEAAREHDGDRGDALSLLVAAGLPRAAIVDELVQMLFAGHHTVPTTLISLLRVLARDPGLARRVSTEAEAEGDPLHDPAAPSLLERVLLETMRVHPPAPILYREVLAPFELAGERLEPGTALWVCTHVLHHDPRSFEHPERFDPERFAPPARARIPAHAHLPFGAGPRTCAASRLAMAQMIEVAAAIVRAHALRPRGGDRFVVERPG